MSSKNLPVILENAEFELEGAVSLISTGNQSLARVESFCQAYRWRGICHFFRGSSPAVLHENLQKSGAAFAFHLLHAKEEGKITSRSTPFFDAIACHDLHGARAIARVSRLTWNREEEYEDDALYISGLMKHFFLQAPEQDMTALVDRYDEVLQGNPDSRLDVLKALITADTRAFEEALLAIIERRADYYRLGVKRGEILEEEFATDGQLFIEGLALCRLAEMKKLSTRRNYKFIPSTARASTPMTYEPDSWRDPTS